MSAKIKGLLAVLALGAFVSLSYLSGASSLAFKGASFADIGTSTGLIRTCENTHGAATCDDDHDGLVNSQEQYWHTDINNPDTDGDGYPDGEEVLTGHNPLVKGPNDWLDQGRNLSQRTVDLALGGMLSGDLNPASAGYAQSVKLLAEAMTDQYKQNTAIVVDALNIVPDSVTALNSYATAMSVAMVKQMLPAFQDNDTFLQSISDVSLSDPSPLVADKTRYAQFVQMAQHLADVDGDRAAAMAAMAVPKGMVPQHTSAIRILRTLQKYYELAAALKDDPLQGAVVLNALVQIEYQVVPQFIYDYRTALLKQFTQ